jgi:hypothetical protein
MLWWRRRNASLLPTSTVELAQEAASEPNRHLEIIIITLIKLGRSRGLGPVVLPSAANR